jgi:hypothetical protein
LFVDYRYRSGEHPRMKNGLLSRPLILRDGKKSFTLLTFDDIRSFMAPADGARSVGVGRVVQEAKTDAQKEQALRVFVTWAKVTGMLK